MKIAVLADIHDNTAKLTSVLSKIKEENCEMVFVLGDYTSIAAFQKLAEADIPVYAVFGNMDRDQEEIETWARSGKRKITLRREMNRVKIGEENYALTHYPEIAEKLLKSGMYKAVFYGHTHKVAKKVEEETLLANPGAVKEGSFGLYDSDTGKFKVMKA